ncbi:MAG: hypothetical protein FGF48_09505, partial [Candidatus Brockarchaeota archaeon]|nr:hypothetical protein [Candidatus Brockarchaeota archaeon]
KEIVKTFFTKKSDWTGEIERLINQYRLRSREIALYTVSVRTNGEVVDLVKTEGYREFTRLMLYEAEEKRLGRCHFCNEEKEVMANPAYPEGSLLIVYNVDKKGFLSGLSGSSDSKLKTHAICVDCRLKLLKGLDIVEHHLRSPLGGLTCL